MIIGKPKYLEISDIIKSLITNCSFKRGDSLPSLRSLASQYGVSLNTAIHAYSELECEGLIRSRDKSGYYVTAILQEAQSSTPKLLKLTRSLALNEIIENVYHNLNDKGIMHFSAGFLDSKYLPIAQMNKNIIEAARCVETNGMRYEPIEGNERLRRNVSKNSYIWGGMLSKDDFITTTGTTNAVALALSALTRPGDTIAVESPCYFVFLQLANSLGLKVIELPTHPETGINISDLESIVKEIKACIIISNFNNPVGYCVTDENKKIIVDLLETYKVPLIEDDLYGDIYFTPTRPRPCKAWDKSGNVVWCSSVSVSLAPGYRVGWMTPGRFKDQIFRQKKIMALSLPSPTQEAAALFMEKDRYELHLRKLRKALHYTSLRFYDTITQSFPEGTKVTKPQGGFMMWVELPKAIDTIHLYNRALAEKISIAPGRMFTLREQYMNCMRLSFGHIWGPDVEKSLIRLGELAQKLK